MPNEQLLVAGGFTTIRGAERRFVALLNRDGTLDESFDLGHGAGDHVWTMAACGDGSLYLGGAFKTFNGQLAPYLARLRLPQIAGSFARVAESSVGQFSAEILGLPGARYEIESSANLQDWSPAGEVHVDGLGNSKEFTAPSSDNARFFRLKSPMP